MKDFRYLKPRPFLYLTAGVLLICYFLKTVLQNAAAGRNAWLFDWHAAGELLGLVSFAFLFMVAVNYWLYKVWPFRALLSIPILKGKYAGMLSSSYTDGAGQAVERHCELIIRQTATDLSIECRFTDPVTQSLSSFSKSITVACEKSEHDVTTIIYTYHNQPNPASPQPYLLNAHDGTATLTQRPEEPAVLELTYYNNERRSQGYIRLVRI
jgi:uncharacterized iron-regulated membrane protein